MSEGPSTKPDSDVYSVLLIIATLFVAAATIFLCVRSNQLFGSANPFQGA